jgi:hypothetical protein
MKREKQKRKVVRVSEIREAIERLRLPPQPEGWGMDVKPDEQWNDILNALMAELEIDL